MYSLSCWQTPIDRLLLSNDQQWTASVTLTDWAVCTLYSLVQVSIAGVRVVLQILICYRCSVDKDSKCVLFVYWHCAHYAYQLTLLMLRLVAHLPSPQPLGINYHRLDLLWLLTQLVCRPPAGGFEYRPDLTVWTVPSLNNCTRCPGIYCTSYILDSEKYNSWHRVSWVSLTSLLGSVHWHAGKFLLCNAL